MQYYTLVEIWHNLVYFAYYTKRALGLFKLEFIPFKRLIRNIKKTTTQKKLNKLGKLRIKIKEVLIL